MNQTMWVGVVLVAILIAGGWWYITQTSTQTISDPPASVVEIDTGVKIVRSEISFTIPEGYQFQEDMNAKRDPSWTQASGVDKQFLIFKDEHLEGYVTNAPKGGPASIFISFYRNDEKLTVEEWMEVRGSVPDGSTSIYKLGGKTGVRYSVLPEMHYGDVVLVQHKGWIVLFYNAHDGPTDSQNQAFEQLLASVVFAP